MNLLEDIRIQQQQDVHKLSMTRDCWRMRKEALANNFPAEVSHELYLLTEGMAKQEWGPDTVVDDFSIQGSLVVRSGNKSTIIT